MQEKLLGCTLVIEYPEWGAVLSGMNMYSTMYPNLLDTWVALLDGEPVGWVLRAHTTYKAGQGAKKRGRGMPVNGRPIKGEAMFYVHPDHRRKGIGRALRDLIEREHGPGIVTAWDDISEGFYGTFKDWELQREDEPAEFDNSSFKF
jgi:GNAT superfamily N-acetyltransferase